MLYEGCGIATERCSGSIYCEHLYYWVWSSEIITTAPGKQHRRCSKCGRRECVPVCADQVPCDDCRDPLCEDLCHWEERARRREIEHTSTCEHNVAETAGPMVLKNGILRYR